jgi:hypothetical protein
LASETREPSPGDHRRSSGEHLIGVVTPQGQGWVAHFDGDIVYEGDSPIDAAHRAHLDLQQRGGGELVVLDSAGRHFKRFIVAASQAT